MPEPIEIEAALPCDVAGIFEVRTSVRENHLSVEELKALGITPESVAALLVEGSPSVWVARRAGRVIGFSMVDLEAGSLFAIFVRPEEEGLGIGRRLLERAEAALFVLHRVAWLETARESRAARFYRRSGWGNEEEIGGGDLRLEKRRPV